MNIYNIIIGLSGSIIISLLAYKKESLSKSGVLATILIGATIFYFASPVIWISLIMFFGSSSVFSKLKKFLKNEKLQAKGSNRDYIQVLANGLVATVFSVIYYYTNNSIFEIAALITIAVSTSDTWASELGTLTKQTTVSILTFKPIKKGLSGGISLLGTFSSICGAGFIATIYFFYQLILTNNNIENIFINSFIIASFGFLGSLLDSILGATLQVKYQCNICDVITEKRYHHNQKTKKYSGLTFINNDVVNFLSSNIVPLLYLVLTIIKSYQYLALF